MPLKDLLQNPDESKRTAKRVLKASAAFTSVLLLGNKETGSKGLVRTVGGAAAVGTTGFLASMAAQSSSASVEEEEDHPCPRLKRSVRHGDIDGNGDWGY